MSQSRILIVSDTYYLTHIFLKAEASARSFPKWYCFKLQGVKNLIMSATFHGCHTHLWESPNVQNLELSGREYEIESLEGGAFCLPPPLKTLPHSWEVVLLPSPDWEFLLSWLFVEIHGIHEQVLSQVVKDRKTWETLFYTSFYQKNKRKIVDLQVYKNCTCYSPWTGIGFRFLLRKIQLYLQVKTHSCVSKDAPQNTTLCQRMYVCMCVEECLY